MPKGRVSALTVVNKLMYAGSDYVYQQTTSPYHLLLLHVSLHVLTFRLLILLMCLKPPIECVFTLRSIINTLGFFEWLFPTLLNILIQRQKDGSLDDITQWIIEILKV